MPLNKMNCDLVRERWTNVRNNVRKMLAQGVDDEFKSLTTGKQFDVTTVKQDIELLAQVDAHQLLRRMESIVHEHVMAMKVDLWTHLITNNKDAKVEEIDEPGIFEVTSPEHTITFLKLLLEKFTQNHRTVNNMCALFSEMDQHFTQIGINWRVLNHYLFDSIIYKDALMKIELEVVEEVIGCDLRGSVHDTAEQEEERSLKEYGNNNFSHQHLAKSFRLLRRLMLTSREIFKNADAKVKEYAKEDFDSKLGQEVQKRIVEDEEFFLSHRRYLRWFSKIVQSPSGSCCRAFEEAFNKRFQSSENPEDREDDEAFLGRLNQMFDRGLNVQTVCAEESERDSTKVNCGACGEEHCGCDSCQLSHLIICGIPADELNRRLTIEEPGNAPSHKCGSGLYLHRFMTRNEHMANAYGSWDFTKWGGAASSDEEEDEDVVVMNAIEEIDNSTPNARLANAPKTIREREDQLKRKRQERELENYHERDPSTSGSSSDDDEEEEIVAATEVLRQNDQQDSMADSSKSFINDGCRKLNEQLQKDLEDLKNPKKDEIPFCCLPHRTTWRRKHCKQEKVRKLIFDCNCHVYPYTKNFSELNLKSNNDLIMSQERFKEAYEADVLQVGFIRYSITSLIAGYAHTMKDFYVSSDPKWRKTIAERVLKEAAEAARHFGDFSYKGQNAEEAPPTNEYTYHVSQVQEMIKQNNNSHAFWAKIDVRHEDQVFMKRLENFDLSVLTALPRRGITFYFLRSIYPLVFEIREQTYKLDSVTYSSADDSSQKNNFFAELHKLTMLESLWIAMVFASTVTLKTDMEFDCLQQTANHMAEYIVLTRMNEEESIYEPVSHFLNMCLIFRVLMKCMLTYKDTLGEERPKAEEQVWEYAIDESGLTEQDHQPDFRNPHHLSQWQKRLLKDGKISLLELCEVSGDVVNGLKQLKGFVKNRQHLQEQIMLRTLVLKTTQLQKHLDEEKSGVNQKRLNRLRKLQNMKQKENDQEWCPHRCEENPATCCGETEEREKDLDEIVADIEGDTKARQAKKLKKKQKQQLRQQQLEEERKKKEAEQKVQEEADNIRKEQELKEQHARDEEKRKEDIQRQRERDREMKEKGEKEKKKKTKKKAVKTKDSSPIVIEEPVYSEEGGLVWQKSTTPPQPEPVKTPKEVKEKRPKRAKKTQEDESLDEDRDGLSSVSVSETATPLHYVDSLGGPTHIEPIDEEAPCYNFMAVGRESIRSTMIPPRTPPSSAIPTGPITPAPSSSGSPHSVEAPPGFEQLGNAHRAAAAQERRRPEASGLQAALGSGSSLLEQWHMMNADNAEILRSLLSTQAVQSQIGVRRPNPAPAPPTFSRQHSAHGFGQNGGPSTEKSAIARAIVGNSPAVPTEISPPKTTGLFGEDVFGRSLPNQDQFRQMSNVTPSEFNSLKQNGNRPNFGANSNRHSLIEPSIFSAFGDFSNSGGRLSVPPDSSRQTSDTPFKIARTSTENMYESDEMFKKCTMDVFKSIWSDAPEEANSKRLEAPSAPNNHTNASTSLTGMEFLRHAAFSNRPVAADAPSSSNGPSTAFRFKSDVHYGANYTSKFGYRHF